MNTIQSTSFPCRRSRDAFNIEVFVHSHEEMKARLSRVRYLFNIILTSRMLLARKSSVTTNV